MKGDPALKDSLINQPLFSPSSLSTFLPAVCVTGILANLTVMIFSNFKKQGESTTSHRKDNFENVGDAKKCQNTGHKGQKVEENQNRGGAPWKLIIQCVSMIC